MKLKTSRNQLDTRLLIKGFPRVPRAWQEAPFYSHHGLGDVKQTNFVDICWQKEIRNIKHQRKGALPSNFVGEPQYLPLASRVSRQVTYAAFTLRPSDQLSRELIVRHREYSTGWSAKARILQAQWSFMAETYWWKGWAALLFTQSVMHESWGSSSWDVRKFYRSE
jgi:hypothetical protein